jgi:IS30 family transposase
MADNLGVMPIQMDVVEGLKDDLKCFLSLSWPHLQLSLYFLMNRQTARCVEETMTYLYRRLGTQLFEMLFPLILTDNGSEFSNPTALENLDTRVFHCDPGASHQKGNVESQNGLFRRIVPKGYSMENLSFKDSFLINAHLNSYVRLSVNNKTAFKCSKVFTPKQSWRPFTCMKWPPMMSF